VFYLLDLQRRALHTYSHFLLSHAYFLRVIHCAPSNKCKIHEAVYFLERENAAEALGVQNSIFSAQTFRNLACLFMDPGKMR